MAARLHTVAAKAARRCSRWTSSTLPSARTASTVSAVLTGMPARRRAPANPTVRSSRLG